MGHELRAVIGDMPALEAMASQFPSAEVKPLKEHLGIVRITPDLEAEIHPEGPYAGWPVFRELTASDRIDAWAREGSRKGMVAYIEAEWQDGMDHQGSVVWVDGSVAVGPMHDDNGWDKEKAPAEMRPVNKALRILGVERGGSPDEWRAVDLDRHLPVGQRSSPRSRGQRRLG